MDVKYKIFCLKICLLDFHLLEAIVKVKSSSKTIIKRLLKIQEKLRLKKGYHGYVNTIMIKTIKVHSKPVTANKSSIKRTVKQVYKLTFNRVKHLIKG